MSFTLSVSCYLTPMGHCNGLALWPCVILANIIESTNIVVSESGWFSGELPAIVFSVLSTQVSCIPPKRRGLKAQVGVIWAGLITRGSVCCLSSSRCSKIFFLVMMPNTILQHTPWRPSLSKTLTQRQPKYNTRTNRKKNNKKNYNRTTNKSVNLRLAKKWMQTVKNH